jgi:hypothetical protein
VTIEGHPFRIRYMVPLVAIQAIGLGVAASAVRRRLIAVAAIAVIASLELRPLDSKALDGDRGAMGSAKHRPPRPGHHYLRSQYRGETVMASMGSLGHYMHDLSAVGLSLRDFLHEGNGDIWLAALEGARPFAGGC